MKLYTITVGIDFDRNGIALDNQDANAVLAHFGDKLTATFGGFTQTTASGGYLHGNGKFVKETSVVFSVYAEGNQALNLFDIKALCVWLKNELNQESIFFTSQNIEGGLVK